MHATHTPQATSVDHTSTGEGCAYLFTCWSSLVAFSAPEPPFDLFLILNSLNFFFSPSVSASLSAAPSRLASLLENKPFRDFLDELFFAIAAGWVVGKTRVGGLQLMGEELQRKSQLASHGRLLQTGDICSCGSRRCRMWSSGERTRPLHTDSPTLLNERLHGCCFWLL